MRVVAYVPDLMDRSKVTAAAPGAAFVNVPAELVTATVEGAADLVLVDLGRPGVLAVLAEVVATGARVVGFGSHVERSTLEEAAATGCEAMPRSLFFRSVADLAAG
jgi:hypothetical protein